MQLASVIPPASKVIWTVRIDLIALNFGINLMASLSNLNDGSARMLIFAPLEGLRRAVVAKGGFGQVRYGHG